MNPPALNPIYTASCLVLQAEANICVYYLRVNTHHLHHHYHRIVQKTIVCDRQSYKYGQRAVSVTIVYLRFSLHIDSGIALQHSIEMQV
jgi:hypothetical protein